MADPPEELARLAALLPDEPRFVETRGMLLEGRCEVLGLELGPSPSFVTRDGDEKLVCVVGSPAPEAVSEAVARNGGTGEVIAMSENVACETVWKSERGRSMTYARGHGKELLYRPVRR